MCSCAEKILVSNRRNIILKPFEWFWLEIAIPTCKTLNCLRNSIIGTSVTEQDTPERGRVGGYWGWRVDRDQQDFTMQKLADESYNRLD